MTGVKVILDDPRGLDMRQRRRIRRVTGRLIGRARSLIGSDIVHQGKVWRVHDMVNGRSLILRVDDNDRLHQTYLPWWELGRAEVVDQ